MAIFLSRHDKIVDLVIKQMNVSKKYRELRYCEWEVQLQRSRRAAMPKNAPQK